MLDYEVFADAAYFLSFWFMKTTLKIVLSLFLMKFDENKINLIWLDNLIWLWMIILPSNQIFQFLKTW